MVGAKTEYTHTVHTHEHCTNWQHVCTVCFCLLQFTHVTHFPKADCWDQLPWQPPIIWWLLTLIFPFFPCYFFHPPLCFSLPPSFSSIYWHSVNEPLKPLKPPPTKQNLPQGWFHLFWHVTRLIVYHTFKLCSRRHNVLSLLAITWILPQCYTPECIATNTGGNAQSEYHRGRHKKNITFHACKRYGGRKLISGQHQQSSTSSQRRPRDSWPWADFIFIRLTEPRGRDEEEPQQSLGFSLSVSHVVKWEHGGEMSHKTQLLAEPFKTK